MDSQTLDAPAQQAATTPVPPRLGAPWPGQGGIYAGLMRGTAGQPDYHLIVPTDAAARNDSVAWGPRGTTAPGCDSDSDGAANTLSLVQSGGEYPAAQWAAGLSIDGLSDFYLPSRKELALCWVNVPELFQDGWHWSSTQDSRYCAWVQDFGDGAQNYGGKACHLHARAVRRLIIS